jgi:hypothetical protein
MKALPMLILRNAARCRRCGTLIESRQRHEYSPCRCGAIAVDGGLAYLKRCGQEADIEELAETIPPLHPREEAHGA